jgi:hypothetical protein
VALNPPHPRNFLLIEAETEMAKVTIYKVMLYDVASDEPRVSRRMATRRGVEMMQGSIIEGSEVEIDDAHLNGEQWTERDFNPYRRTGFQQQVT